MNKYAIITPTFIGHFQYIPAYLKSFDIYLEDKDNIDLLFVIEKESNKKFQKIISPYKNNLNIKVLIFDDILLHFDIKESPPELLQKYGKFTYQTFKKMYTMLFTKYNYYFVLDSESMLIKPTKIQEIFENFFQEPFISGSKIEQARRPNSDFNILKKNIDNLLGFDCPYWFLENFVWFYDLKILKQLIKEHGYPLEMAEKILNKNKELAACNDVKFGIFEICLYQNYLYKNHKKLGYKFQDIDENMKSIMSNEEIDDYKKYFYSYYHGGCGIMEQAMLLLSAKNINQLANIFKKLNFNIIRCEKTTLKNYKLQKKFLDIVKPNILAVSQNHVFGIKNTLLNKFRYLILDIKNIEKFYKSTQSFIAPIKAFINWALLPFKIIKYFMKILFIALINIIKLRN